MTQFAPLPMPIEFFFVAFAASLLKDLLASLDFVSEPPEFVALMKDKLDPEGLDIIVLNNFLKEFYGNTDIDAVNEVRMYWDLRSCKRLQTKTSNKLGLLSWSCILCFASCRPISYFDLRSPN